MNTPRITVEEVRAVRVELERATDYYLVKEIAYRALDLLEREARMEGDKQ